MPSFRVPPASCLNRELSTPNLSMLKQNFRSGAQKPEPLTQPNHCELRISLRTWALDVLPFLGVLQRQAWLMD